MLLSLLLPCLHVACFCYRVYKSDFKPHRCESDGDVLVLLSGWTSAECLLLAMQARSFMHVKFSEIHLFLFASREKNPVSQERKKKHLMDDKNKIEQEEKRDIAEKRVSCRLLLCCPAR